MTYTDTTYEHIVLNEKRVPMIEGTTMKVEELVLDHLAHGWSPQELHFQHPYLKLGQIYSALAYYWDHREEMNQGIKKGLDYVDQLRQEQGPSAFVERLRAQNLL
jgi:uncharacterized protein (DUF433 family)